MASTQHNETQLLSEETKKLKRKKNREKDSERRRKTPPDNHERCDTPIFSEAPFRVRTQKRKDDTDLALIIAGVLGPFDDKRSNFREKSESSYQQYLGVHRLDSVDGKAPPSSSSGGRKQRPPQAPSIKKTTPIPSPSAAHFDAFPPSASSVPPSSAPAPPPSAPSSSRPSGGGSTSRTAAGLLASGTTVKAEASTAQTLTQVFSQMRCHLSLSPLHEPPRTASPSYNPSHPPPPSHQVQEPHKPSKNPSKKPSKKNPVQQRSPYFDPREIVQIDMKISSSITPPEKMSPDCIDSTVVLPEKTTMPHPLWVRVNYARLSALRPKLNVPLPEQLKRKIDHSINSGSKKRKIPKRRNRDKVSRKNSRGSSKEHRNIKSDVEFSDDQSNVSNTHPADSSCKAQNDKSITVIREAADSSAVAPSCVPLKPYTKYIEDGERLKIRGDEMEQLSPIQCHIFYMESAHHYVMASHQLECDFIRARQEKNDLSAGEKQERISKKIIQLTNETLELCYRMRNFERKSSAEHSLSRSERAILDRLIVICYKCEAHLNLLLYKCDNAKRDMLANASKITLLMKQRDQGDDYCRGTPTSPIMSDEKPTDIRLEHDEWNQMKQYLRTATYLVKAHNKWGIALQKERETNSNHFFNKIQAISEMSELSLMSSLKDLSTYQKAVVEKLRAEIYEPGEESHHCSA